MKVKIFQMPGGGIWFGNKNYTPDPQNKSAGWEVERVEYYRYLWGQGKPKSKVEAETENIVSIWNPLSWIQTGIWIATQSPDVYFVKYWHPIFAPMYAVINFFASQTSRRVVIVDNVTPHEWFPFSRWLFKLMTL